MRYEYERLAREETRLRSAVEKLRVEEAALVTAEHIEPLARSLGMRYPTRGQVIRVDRSPEQPQ